MAKIIVIQHVAREPLGNLDPLIKKHKHRIRYVNFVQNDSKPNDIQGYDALIVLGGPMNVTEMDAFPYLQTEVDMIKQALDRELPILGICLGSQLLAHALGAKVYPALRREIGWYELSPTLIGQQDSLTRHFKPFDKIFQWHGQTFDLPQQAEHLIAGTDCVNQGFRYGKNAYGFQFHLEVTPRLIEHWVNDPQFQEELNHDRDQHRQSIINDTETFMNRSLELSHHVFSAFLDLLPKVSSSIILPTRN